MITVDSVTFTKKDVDDVNIDVSLEAMLTSELKMSGELTFVLFDTSSDSDMVVISGIVEEGDISVDSILVTDEIGVVSREVALSLLRELVVSSMALDPVSVDTVGTPFTKRRYPQFDKRKNCNIVTDKTSSLIWRNNIVVLKVLSTVVCFLLVLNYMNSWIVKNTYICLLAA